MNLSSRFITILGHCLFAILFLLAIVFYKERMLFSDMAFYTYQMLLKSSVSVQHNRFVAVLPQILPLLAIKASLSLRVILVSYSVSFILFNYLAFIYTWHFLKNSGFALFILLLSVGLYTDSFYWCSSELPLGVSLTTVIFAIAHTRRRFEAMSRFEMFLLFGLMPFAVFAHPLAMIPIIFGFIFIFILQNNEIEDNTNAAHSKIDGELRYWIGFVFVCLILIKTFAVTPSSYEIESGKQAKLLLFEYLKKPFDAPILQVVGSAFLTKYYLLPIFFGVISVFYFKNKKWLKLGLFMGAIIGLFILIHTSNAKCLFGFYIENFYTVIAFCLFLPVALDWLPRLNFAPKLVMTGVCTVLALRIFTIVMAHDVFTDRLAFLSTTLEKSKAWGGKKFVMDLKDAPPLNAILLEWASPYETLLLSAIDAPTEARTILINSNPHANDWAFSAQLNTLVGAFEITPYKDLPVRYFQLPDEKYQYITQNGLIK